MIGFNHKIDPFYLPRIDEQEVDKKYVLLICVPAGEKIVVSKIMSEIG